MEINLRIPGPTPLPPTVRQALSQPVIGHRSAEFKQILKGILANLKTIFQTESDVLLLTCSGTGGMEAAIVNTTRPVDAVLAVSIGHFGNRFAAIAETCGAEVTRLDFPWGQAADPAAIKAHLETRPDTKAILVTFNETSTGVTNDLENIAQVIHSFGNTAPLLIVDAVSAIAAIDLPVDKWNCDIVITSSQKALMAPPGIALVSVSPKAWAIINSTPTRSYYFDLKALRKQAEEGQTPTTPPVSDIFALREGINLILEEGLPNVFARHHRIAEHTRQGILKLGLELLADPKFASDAVTAVKFPEGISADAVRAQLKKDFAIEVSGGQGPLKGQIIRIGHMGYVSEDDINAVLSALKAIME